MSTPGTTYIPSGKFDIGRSIAGLIGGVLGAMVIGYLYGVITDVDPLIYLNMLVLFGTVVALVAFTAAIRNFGHSRNKIVNVVVAAVICYAAWYAQWVYFIIGFNITPHIILSALLGLFNPVNVFKIPIEYSEIRTISVGHLASSGAPISGTPLLIIYFIELVAFMAPVYFAWAAKEYYCEACNRFYSKAELWSAESARFNAEFSRAPMGSYGFLNDFAMAPTYTQLSVDPSLAPELLKAEYHYCNACNQNDIINLSTVVLKYNNKKKAELTGEKSLVNSTFVDARTRQAMMDKVKGKTTGLTPAEIT